MSDYAYTAKCGCCDRFVWAHVDTPDHKDGLAEDMAKMVKAGFTIVRLPLDEVREGPWMCEREAAA